MSVAEDQTTMFPELDLKDPKQKALLSAARKYAKDKAERDALLTTSKEKVDASMGKVIALLHELGLKKFKHEGVKAELIETKEKCTVEEDEEEDE
jgi:hypothetical protein